MLPGVFADPGRAEDPVIKMAAVTRWDPDAVIRGRAAAALTYWPDIAAGSTVQVASPFRHRRAAGVRVHAVAVPPELVQLSGPIPVTTPSLTAIELATLDDSDPIDVALRSKQANLESLTTALRLTSHRRGNAHRWQVMLDSRAEPWSRAERLAHRLYRQDGITGWATNAKLVLPAPAPTTSTSPSSVSASPARSTAGSTTRSLTCSRPTGCGRTLWCSTGGWCCVSPGGCSPPTPTTS